MKVTLFFIFAGLTQRTSGFSVCRLRKNAHVSKKNTTGRKHEATQVRCHSEDSINRRQAMNTLIRTAIPAGIMMSSPRPSKAACLSGDTSSDCIGVYKLPLDDDVNIYIDTPEHLAKMAPDLRWVPMTEYPKSYKAAKEELVELQANLKNVTPLVLKGDFTAAGILLLAINPRVTVAGRIVLRALENNTDLSMRAMRTENAFFELLASLGAADIVIGQALNGSLGSITMSQIQILDDVRNADQEFKELMRAIPENYEG